MEALISQTCHVWGFGELEFWIFLMLDWFTLVQNFICNCLEPIQIQIF